jgi:8-oxo-dGTP pyrophosphatase MutT (NUDIX family)
VRLEPAEGPPHRFLGSEVLAEVKGWKFRHDRVVWPGGQVSDFRVLEGPEAAVMVPYFEDGTTVLVRQWRHSWGESSWEAAAGTLEEGETPSACAERELAEEVGLRAASWTSLGTARGTAVATIKFHLFLARDLTRVESHPEAAEADLIVRELPFDEALEAALDGWIEHAASVTAICRAAKVLGRL